MTPVIGIPRRELFVVGFGHIFICFVLSSGGCLLGPLTQVRRSALLHVGAPVGLREPARLQAVA